MLRLRFSADKSMDCIAHGKCSVHCKYHKWLRTVHNDRSCGGITHPDLLYTMNRFVREGTVDKKQRLQQVGHRAKRQRTDSKQPGLSRLLAFLRLTDTFRTYDWSSARFSVNEAIYMRLTAAHLHLICGKAEARQERTVLLRYLSQYENLETQQNLVWVTNRQQGKTTTVSMFIAALSLTSVQGGLLATIYSTSLDRSCELLKGSKQFLYEYKKHNPSVDFVRDTDRMYCIKTTSGTVCEIAARPKNADSCR